MTDTSTAAGPLSGIRVIEFSHMVMGPSCGMVLADLGADVIKIEPAPAGDNSRRLTGAALGFYPTYNRNKRSVCLDMKTPEGFDFALSLIKTADVIVENFRPGAMEKLGLGPTAMIELNPRLVYCACKGFLPGPYEKRAALDEVVQMMGGLAYMTGPPGRPLRAGASVNDIMGGVFGAVAVLAALRERDQTGKGSYVQSGLFETNMLLVAQHMAYAAITGKDLPSFGDPAMGRPWPLYDIFETADEDHPIFVGTVTLAQWRAFCEEFGFRNLLEDPELATMPMLAANRARIIAKVGALFRTLSKDELSARVEKLGLPFAPIARPSELFEDPHMLASGGMMFTEMATAESAPGPAVQPVAGIPGLPISLDNGRRTLSRQPPRAGQHSAELAREIGLSEDDIGKMIAAGTLIVA
ncbi:CaiB/BaiF CoA-transferase family protein [Sphingobium sp.]|uniref:CaiB/BaiF CoA transferase family protein n=1 Tax=Sphingobium sp. TaxID=1912891 RepID=UPI002C09C777|nr:CaiB/BaiF CoA-transferase family protein [Sphingobium sp.]HUD92924.1 CaiB/BaiF CoA-transferase family protein [Sphingobium sp.]